MSLAYWGGMFLSVGPQQFQSVSRTILSTHTLNSSLSQKQIDIYDVTYCAATCGGGGGSLIVDFALLSSVQFAPLSLLCHRISLLQYYSASIFFFLG